MNKKIVQFGQHGRKWGGLPLNITVVPPRYFRYSCNPRGLQYSDKYSPHKY